MTAATQSRPSISFEHDTPELAEVYDQTSDRQFEHGKNVLIPSLNLQPGEHVLDVGAGTGRLAEYVASIVGPSGRVVAVDPLPLRVDLARRRANGRFEVSVAQAEDLSAFPDESFDAVYLNSVFHWVQDKPRALAEARRVLRKGGRIALNTQNPDKPHDLRYLVEEAVTAAGLPFSAEQVQPTIGVPQTELEPLLTSAGFVDYAATLHSFDTLYSEVDELIALSTSSSFGNFLAVLSDDERERLRLAIEQVLEPKRSSGGFNLTRYLTFLTARKPQD
ncbi:class I SAM-dependent methyltransferase [Pseudochelatococcus contaminans]|uniref:Ubiquinone/menaquinone biosynthesis C-methylase UbiE n=1 Tax=Pseudochelatococcus contaminans TaxID=1538103 RepID=A0A7W6EHW9_9HYPH|nr:methyltransferase domain-containing protein [Pseudochelatococcus contaminans]MBB3810453.1 ubiquinone/menaquinone biosynthesis C-methylase UbiE [Pseudochelatococcus contaminans]